MPYILNYNYTSINGKGRTICIDSHLRWTKLQTPKWNVRCQTQALCTFLPPLVFALAKNKTTCIDRYTLTFLQYSVLHFNHFTAPTTALKIEVLTFLDMSTTLDTSVTKVFRAVDYRPTSPTP